MPRRIKLEGEALARYITRARNEIISESERLGFDAGNVLRSISEFGASEEHYDRSYMRRESTAFGASVSVDVTLKRDTESPLGFTAACSLNWGSTERSVSQAVHAISLYQRAVEMAAIIEGVVR
jgi:hypothetical protein